MWFLNGCNPITKTHAWRWTGNSSDPRPWYDVECGCGSFVMEARSGKIIPSEELKREMSQVAEFAAAQQEQ